MTKLYFIKYVVVFLASTLFFVESFAAGVVVLAGGGEDGKIGDRQAWSYKLYKRLIDNGDINGDKKLKVAVISYYQPSDNETPDYFKSIGANSAEAIVIENREQANDPRIADKINDADVIFFRGGDQAEYYRNWKDTRLSQNIKKIDTNGGALGGTSAGAMSLAGYALAGGKKISSQEALMDSQSPFLDDERGGSSIHHDFLNIVPDVIIDTHYGERARLGRALAVHAKASEDYNRKDLLTIAVSEQTGVAISNGKAEVYGHGTVEFIQQTPETKSIRNSGEPLVYTNLRNDVLTEGWIFDIQNKRPDMEKIPVGTKVRKPNKRCGVIDGNITIDGSKKTDSSHFEYTPLYGKNNYQLAHREEKKILAKGIIGVTNGTSYDEDELGHSENALAQAALYRAIYDQPSRSAFLISNESMMKSYSKSSDKIGFEKNLNLKVNEASSIILDCSNCTHLGLSPRVTNLDNGSKTLRLPALINMRVHVVGSSEKNNTVYNLNSHKIEKISGTQSNLDCDFREDNQTNLNKISEKISISVPNCEP